MQIFLSIALTAAALFENSSAYVATFDSAVQSSELPADLSSLDARKLADKVLELSWSVGSGGERQKFIHVLLKELKERQNEDGTWTLGWNEASPPDSAFVVKSLWLASRVLSTLKSFDIFKREFEVILKPAGEALITGGIHTANHRWLVCAALAGLNEIYKDRRYLSRISEWLAEGIDLDADGEFSERSAGIYSPLSTQDLFLVATLTHRTGLNGLLEKHLRHAITLFQEPYEILTLGSRRQDQWRIQKPLPYLWVLMATAAQLNDPSLLQAAAWLQAKAIESKDYDIFTYSMLKLNPTWRISVEKGGLPAELARSIPNSGLFRLKKSGWDLSAYSGQDKNFPVGSGTAQNPTILTARSTRIIIDSIRFSSGLFGTGFIPADKIESPDGKSLLISAERSIGYYQPLQGEQLQIDGNYKLEFEGRFFSKLGFSNRAKSNESRVTYELKVMPTENALTLNLRAVGPKSLWMTMEICFRSWKQSTADFQEMLGAKFTHKPKNPQLWSEQYSQHHGQLLSPGECFYLNGAGLLEKVIQIENGR